MKNILLKNLIELNPNFKFFPQVPLLFQPPFLPGVHHIPNRIHPRLSVSSSVLILEVTKNTETFLQGWFE